MESKTVSIYMKEINRQKEGAQCLLDVAIAKDSNEHIWLESHKWTVIALRKN